MGHELAYYALKFVYGVSNFTATLSSIFVPDQDMANSISLELARAAATVPSYSPYIIPQLSEKPWVVPTPDHASAIARWRENTRDNRRRVRQEISFQCWVTYQMRFIITAHLCKAFDPFGGIGPQFSHLAICLNIAIIESVATAMSYDRLVKIHLQAAARRRDVALDFGAYLSKESQEFKRKAIAENTAASSSHPPPKGKAHLKGNGKGDNRKGDKGTAPRVDTHVQRYVAAGAVTTPPTLQPRLKGAKKGRQ